MTEMLLFFVPLERVAERGFPSKKEQCVLSTLEREVMSRVRCRATGSY